MAAPFLFHAMFQISDEQLFRMFTETVRDMLDICEAYTLVKPEHMFATVHDAVLYALNAQVAQSPVKDYSSPHFRSLF